MINPPPEGQNNPFPINSTNPINIYNDLKENILDKKCGCKDPLAENSSFCLNCRKSTCPECDLQDHKEHRLILKKEIYYPSQDILKNFNDRINHTQPLEEFKQNALKALNVGYTLAKEELDAIYNRKKEEIENIYEFCLKSVDQVKQNLEKTNKAMKDFDEKNKNFFALQKGNDDLGNHVLLMKLELLDNCEHMNIKTKNEIDYMNNSLNQYLNSISEKFSKLIEFKKELFPDQFVDFTSENSTQNYYSAIDKRLQTYDDMINNIKEKLAKGYNESGSFNNLIEMLKKLEAKDKKGMDTIYNQTSLQSESNSQMGSKGSSFKKYQSPKGVSSGKKGSAEPNRLSQGKNTSEGKGINAFNNQPNSREDNVKRTLFPQNTGSNIKSSSRLSSGSKASFVGYNKDNPQKLSPEQIDLQNHLVQKFFSYVLIDTYNKFFSHKGQRQSFDVNTRIYSQFQERQNNLKEKAKPIAGTNEIMVYSEATQTMQKIQVPLDRSEHGYTNFPLGFRHICIDGLLYIIGGTDAFGNAISICNVFDLKSKEIKRNKDTNFPHSYHSLEYINNYDCIIVVGGEKTKKCEMYDLNKKDWIALPDLNIPRANISIYFNEKTNVVYGFFGMTGPISTTKKTYTDILEVLDFEDLNSGWQRVDYYKSSMIDLCSNYGSAFPFTLDKLIIRGTKNARTNNVFYAIYDMMKNEMYFASEKIVREIQTEEMNIKAYTQALSEK
ncbi:MAG: hypothetical protein MJ252_23485 [archaeon]|nr:hypothetical protein [archaeon]